MSIPRRRTPSPFVRLLPALPLVVAAAVLASPALARTYAFPHVFDQKGRVSNTQNTFDTSYFVTYSSPPGTPASSATVDLYLYEDSGVPMRGLGPADVCNPCSYSLGAGLPRRLKLSMEELLDAAGSFSGVKLGFAVIVVGGQDPDGVAVQGYIVNSHATPGVDISATYVAPNVIGGGGGAHRTFVVPHVLDRPGRISNTPYTFDTSIFATYGGGLPGAPSGTGATVDVYLLDDGGGFVTGGGGSDVCAPCSFPLGAGARKATISIDALVEAAGGFGATGELDAMALIDVQGDASLVSLQGLVVNSHTSATDVSVFGFNPQEITAPGRLGVREGAIAPQSLALSVAPNPVRAGGPGVALGFDLPAAATIEMAIFDINGRQVKSLARGRHAAGSHRLTWDRRDASGATVPAGVYFARLTDEAGSATSRIVAIR